MTVEREVAKLNAQIEAAIGPNGAFTNTMKEVKEQVAQIDERQRRHDLRIDRLEQTEKRRSKWIGAAATAWIGLAVAWAWERLR